ncbi:hypothetical protein F4604DRAFT_1928133 [Suillus subluteus]|nr:hypothetical protein F4604DRAFT_1928133 [Suillus subluteus]
MYLAGIIPGPSEPSGDQLNHFLDPVVDDMLESWEHGIRYNRTALHAGGWVTRSAIACLVCDLPAARKATQLAGPTSHFFCTACHCSHRSTCGRTDIQSESWRLRDKSEVRRYAELWKNAGTSAERNKLFSAHGVRWSPLWRLPYWDPSRQIVVDTMHCLLEGLAHAHFREFLGLTADSAHRKADPIPAFDHLFLDVDLNKPQDFSEKDVRVVKSIYNLLTGAVPNLEGNDTRLIEDHLSELEGRLLSKKAACLQFVSVGLGIGPDVTHPGKKVYKAHWVRSLIAWRRTEPFTPRLSRLRIATPEVMQRIANVIRTADTPSSLRSVPYNFGETKAGTVKADEWRTLTTVYLPIALVSLWGEGSTHRNSEIAVSHCAILDHTMALVSAVHIVCLRSMMTARAAAYRGYIVDWIRDLQVLLPHATHRTNGHMALHVWDYLQLFGPVRSWWCFPYERLIGQLQRLPSNHIFGTISISLSTMDFLRWLAGQQESTLLRSYIQAARLKYWLNRPSCPPVFKEVKALFDRFVSPSINTNPIFTTPPTPTNITPEDLRQLIHVRQVVLHARTLHEGSIYTRDSTHVGNSLIFYYPSGVRNAQPVPGIIKYIFEKEQGVRFAVQRHLPLHSHPDPFRHYPHFPARLYSSALADNLEIVMLGWVVSHFVRWNFSPHHIVAVSLCRDSQLAPDTPSPAAQPLLLDTPIKRDSSTLLPFTTLARCQIDTLNAMGKEMKGHVVGPMPVEEFLDEFLPHPKNHDPLDFTSLFTSASQAEVFNMHSVRKEEDSYNLFINGIQPFAPQLSFVNTSNNADTKNCSSFTFNIKPDVCVYADGTSHGCDISKFELSIEFKWNDAHDAFSRDVDKPIVSQTEKGFNTLGQITSYASAQLGAQYRTHAFSVLIIRNRARIIRWDREGAIITDIFDYNHEPHLADFIYRYARASPAMRSVDTSVSPASTEDAALARTALNLPAATCMFKLAVPKDPAVEESGLLTLIVPQPVAKGFPPVGRWTRTCPAYDILNQKVVMFKDSWRVSIKDVLPEGETYKLLKFHKVRNVAECIAFHDVVHPIPQQNTQTAKFASANWSRPSKPVKIITPHTLHRLVLDIVGEKLTDFASTRQLVQSIRDALFAHKDAYENAKILHRDLSVGNVVIYRGVGFLIDWDLAKLLTIQGPRQTTRTGTWQFMSAHLVKNTNAIHVVEDDLESSFYVVLWTALMYKESYMSIVDRTQFITQIFDANPLLGSGGSRKSDWLVARTYFPQDLFVGSKPLDYVVVELAQFFSHRYSEVPPAEKASLARMQMTLKDALAETGEGHVRTAGHQMMIDALQGFVLESPAYKKEMGMKVLHLHDHVIKIYNKHLQSSGWPDQDAAALQKLQPSEKPTKRYAYTKSLCVSQIPTPVRVQVTPTGKKRRLDPEDSDDALSSVSLDDLASLDQ